MPAIPNANLGMWNSCVDTHGQVWIANDNGNVQLFAPNSGPTTAVQNGYTASNLFCEESGQLYLIGDLGISAVRNGRIRHLPLIPGLGPYIDRYRFLGLIQEPGGDLIAAVGGTAGHGLWKYRAGKWSRYLLDLP